MTNTSQKCIIFHISNMNLIGADMKRESLYTPLVILLLSFPCFAENDKDELEVISTLGGTDLIEQADQQLATISDSKFFEDIQSLSLGAMEDKAYADNLKAIQNAHPLDFTTPGSTSKKYQVVLQPGHHKRNTGATGAQGANVSERSLVAFIVGEIYQDLKDAGIEVAIVDADGTNRPIQTDIFLSIHADGSNNKCSTKPSMGYADKSDLLGVHTIGYALARSLGYDFNDFMKDGYTVNLSKYYMFRKMNSTHFEGVLEVGEVTCPEIERLLISASDTIARNIASTLINNVRMEQFASK